MTNKLTQDFYLVHYNYFTNNATERGEGICYIATPTGHGIRKMDIDQVVLEVTIGLSNSSAGASVVVPTSISYLTSCSPDEFYASPAS